MPGTLGKTLAVLFITGSVVGAAYFARGGLKLGTADADRPLTVPVRRAELRIVVTERGSLESIETVDGICEVKSPTGQVKIIELVPEGSTVKKGDVVCRFDSADIEKNISAQEIKVEQARSKVQTTAQELEIARNKAASDVKKAWVDHQLAILDKEKYEKGDYPVEIEDISSSISQNGSAAETKRSTLEQTQELVRKGFRTPQQLKAAELEYKQFESALKRDQRKKAVKELYERKRKNMELASKVEQTEGDHTRAIGTGKATVAKSKSENVAAEATLEIEERQLEQYKEQLDNCIIRAEQDGVVAYANEPWYDSSRQIREGAQVFNRQKIFTLPDMSHMQVKVNIHESTIKKVKAGQRAEVRLEAFPRLVLKGRVKSVSQLSDSNRMWMSGGAKEYTSVITIESMPEEELRPGMTSEVRIMVGNYANVLVVPLQAVAEHRGLYYAFVEGRDGAFERREVTVGESNDKLIQITDGLTENENVALDARVRSEAFFRSDDDEEDNAGTTSDPKQKDSPGLPTPSEPAAEPAPAPAAPVETAPAEAVPVASSGPESTTASQPQ